MPDPHSHGNRTANDQCELSQESFPHENQIAEIAKALHEAAIGVGLGHISTLDPSTIPNFDFRAMSEVLAKCDSMNIDSVLETLEKNYGYSLDTIINAFEVAHPKRVVREALGKAKRRGPVLSDEEREERRLERLFSTTPSPKEARDTARSIREARIQTIRLTKYLGLILDAKQDLGSYPPATEEVIDAIAKLSFLNGQEHPDLEIIEMQLDDLQQSFACSRKALLNHADRYSVVLQEKPLELDEEEYKEISADLKKAREILSTCLELKLKCWKSDQRASFLRKADWPFRSRFLPKNENALQSETEKLRSRLATLGVIKENLLAEDSGNSEEDL